MDWLSHFIAMMPVNGRLDLRCLYGAPWRIEQAAAEEGAMAYHAVLAGSAIVEDPMGGNPQRIDAGDILMVPGALAHSLHDGSGMRSAPAINRPSLNLVFSENAATGERLDMLCGHFIVSPTHHRVLQAYLPPLLVVKGPREAASSNPSAAASQVMGLLTLMKAETSEEGLGSKAMLNAFSAALFTLALRRASEAADTPPGLLTLAANPRLASAVTAMFEDPGHAWTLPALARLCHMSRATLARQFQKSLGRSATDLLLDIRMTRAARELKKPGQSTGAAAALAGYQSEAAFQRAFKLHTGVTPSQWRKTRTQ